MSVVISCLLVFRYSRGVMSPGRHVRTRLYFTSESHVHSLLSVFRYGGLLDVRSGLTRLMGGIRNNLEFLTSEVFFQCSPNPFLYFPNLSTSL